MTKTSPPFIIALDGSAASGKSTLGQRLANSLGYLFFDTGIMYRAVTWIALVRGVDVHNDAAISQLARDAEIDIHAPSKADGRACDVLIGNQDVTWDIRSREVDANVSIVSVYADVRKALSEKQRQIGLRGKVVMVGRDIGTVVLPEADLKIYLDASAEERAKRRYNELVARGNKANYAEILNNVIQRDHIDSTRAVAPLRPADDAVIVDSDKLNADQVFAQVLTLCK